LINDEFVINELHRILSSRPIGFEFVVKRRNFISDNNNRKTFAVTINNKSVTINNNFDKVCLLFEIIKNKDTTTTTNEYSIYIVSLEKCAPINNYGTFILDSIKEFAYEFAYYSIIIRVDASTLVFICNHNGKDRKVYIPLTELSILSTGESWYNRLGFYALTNLDEKYVNSLIIQKIIKDIYDLKDENDNIDINTFIETQQRNRKNSFVDSECLKMILSYEDFRELYDFILKITKTNGDDSIQNVFLALNNFIRSNCGNINRRCEVDYSTMKRIGCFIEFMFGFLGIKYTRDDLVYNVPRDIYQKGRGKKIYMKNKTRKRK
jgi:hypothetical protein